jgi:hypothetical protein
VTVGAFLAVIRVVGAPTREIQAMSLEDEDESLAAMRC